MERKAATPLEIQVARQLFQTDDVEIDDDAAVSISPDGTWVSAWVWIGTEVTAVRTIPDAAADAIRRRLEP
jgi:hypothetical protein